MAETSTAETNTPDTNASETSDSSGLSNTLSNILSALGDLAQLLRHIFRLRYRNLPAVPLASIPSLIDTLIKLGKRSVETQPALDGLSNIYTIDGHTATGQEFLFGESGRDVQAEGDREALRERLESGGDLSESEGGGTLSTLFEQALDGNSNADEASYAEATEDSELTKLFLDTPDQWSISWTNFMGVYDNAQPQLPVWARTVTVSPEGAQAATEAFWPNIADYCLAYNLLILAKVDANRVVGLRAAFGSHFVAFEGAFAEGRLYAIDMSLFQQVSANKVDGFERFTPATITLLEMSSNKDLLPVAVRVSGQNDRDHQIYVHGQATEATWIYALQAAKVSITVWGI